MIIRRFKFTNYRSFGDSIDPVRGELTDLRKLNMIYGDNSSGKSNILLFCDLIFGKKRPRERAVKTEKQSFVLPEDPHFWTGSIPDQPFIFHKNIRRNPIEFEFDVELTENEVTSASVKLGDINPPYIITFSGRIRNFNDPSHHEMVLLRATINGLDLFGQTGSISEAGVTNFELFEPLMSILDDSVLLIDNNRLGNVITGKGHVPLQDWLHDHSLNAIDRARYEDFISFVQNLRLSGNPLTAFQPTFARHGSSVITMIGAQNERIPLGDIGTGLLQVLSILASIFESSARVIIIEEIELNMSPKLQSQFRTVLLELVQSGKIDQVIFTSHSEYFTFITELTFHEVTMDRQVSTVRRQSARPADYWGDHRLDR